MANDRKVKKDDSDYLIFFLAIVGFVTIMICVGLFITTLMKGYAEYSYTIAYRSSEVLQAEKNLCAKYDMKLVRYFMSGDYCEGIINDTLIQRHIETGDINSGDYLNVYFIERSDEK